MNTLKVTGSDSGAGAHYTIQVDGQVQKTSDVGDADQVNGGTINGKIGGGSDTYQFTGTVVSADLPSIATLYVNGEQIDPSAIGGGGSGSYSPPTQTPTQQPQPTTTQRPQTTTVGGSGPDTLAWVVALGAIGVAVYMSQQ
ncbi:hypothetical protein [Haloarcula sp. H-GB5]